MPTYQYACKDCGNQFEQVQAFSDPSLTACPECGGHLRKVYGSVGVVFKGSGFYRTDSRSGSGKSSIAAGTKSESGSAPSSSEKSSSEKSGSAKSGSEKSSPAAKVAASSAPAKAAS